MTMVDSQRLAAEWGDRECAHPSFDTVKVESDIPVCQACTQCGQSLEEIVQSSSHE